MSVPWVSISVYKCVYECFNVPCESDYVCVPVLVYSSFELFHRKHLADFDYLGLLPRPSG